MTATTLFSSGLNCAQSVLGSHAPTLGLDRALALRLSAVHGSVVCRELLGCDLMSAGGQAAMKAGNLVNEVCLKCVDTADRLVTELIRENP